MVSPVVRLQRPQGSSPRRRTPQAVRERFSGDGGGGGGGGPSRPSIAGRPTALTSDGGSAGPGPPLGRRPLAAGGSLSALTSLAACWILQVAQARAA